MRDDQESSVSFLVETRPIFYLGDGIGGLGNSSLIIEVGHVGMETELFFTILDDNMNVTQCFDSGFSLQTDTWYHFAAVVGQSFNTGYLNGIEMTQRHYNFGRPSDDDFFQEVVTKQVLRGHTLTVLLESPGLTFRGEPIILAAEFVPTGMVSLSAHLQGLWLGFPGLFLLVDGTQPGPAGFNCVVIPGGTSFGFEIPVTLMPQSVVLQGAVLSFSAFSGLALSEAHDIQIL